MMTTVEMLTGVSRVVEVRIDKTWMLTEDMVMLLELVLLDFLSVIITLGVLLH